jgi:hypothetical protein
VLRRMFVPKRDEIIRNWGKLYNDELHNLYPSPSIIRTMKSRKMRWEGQIRDDGPAWPKHVVD